jgi:hypothetical protein
VNSAFVSPSKNDSDLTQSAFLPKGNRVMRTKSQNTKGIIKKHLFVTAYLLTVGFPCLAQTSYSGRCPDLKSDASVTSWREKFIDSYYGGDNPSGNIQTTLQSCFANRVPACLARAITYLGPIGNQMPRLTDDDVAVTSPQRQIPKELLNSGSDDQKYILNPKLEAIAKKKGWPVVRYKSRHAGGFDRSTSSLIMIEVPGKSLKPPVDFDRFVNISIPKDKVNDDTEPVPQEKIPTPKELKKGKEDYPTVMTMVTVQHGSTTSAPKIFFQKFNRHSDIYFPEDMNNTPGACYSCHSSGMRAISPLGYGVDEGERQLPPDLWNMVKKINTDMANAQGNSTPNWGSINFRGTVASAIDPNRYGPVFGPSSPLTHKVSQDSNGKDVISYPTREKDFIMGTAGKPGCASSNTTIDVTDIFKRGPGSKNIYTFSSNPPIDPEKVAAAMDCQMCHNGNFRGVLTGQTSVDMIRFKILVDKSMPDGAHVNPMDNSSPTAHVKDELNPNERIALANCLVAEFNSELSNKREWMTEQPCDDNAKAPTPKSATLILKMIQNPSCPSTDTSRGF